MQSRKELREPFDVAELEDLTADGPEASQRATSSRILSPTPRPRAGRSTTALLEEVAFRAAV